MNTPTLSWHDASFALLERLRVAGRAESTLKNDRRSLHRLGRFLGWKPPCEVTREDLEGFLRHLRETVKPATARLHAFCARRFFASLARRGEVLVNPAEFLEPPRKPHPPLGRVLTREEVEKLLASPDTGWPIGVRDRALLEVLYSSGLRAFEVRAVRVEDVDLDGGQLTVRQGKGQKDRVCPLTSEAVRWLRRYLEAVRPRWASYQPEVGEVFLSRWGKPLSQQMLLVKVKRLGEAAGVPVSCHVLRRTMATHLLQGGARPSVVAGCLGQSDLKTLHRYVARAGVELRKAHGTSHPREADRD